MNIRLITNILKERGYHIYDVDDEFSYGYCKKTKLAFRFFEDKLQFGYLPTFDRWSNSQDWEYNGFPSNEDEFLLVMNIVEEQAKEVVVNREWHENFMETIDLSLYMRKAKRNKKKKAYIDRKNSKLES